jgi:segregation and condensation protein A
VKIAADDPDFAFEEALDGEALRLDLDGFEGPLDLLLALARTQKVDLARISLTALADQYLAFLSSATALRIDIAGDYLVMAAWLALLKARLLLPKAARNPDEPDEDALRAHLAQKLQRLEAARAAAKALWALDQVDRDVFLNPRPQAIALTKTPAWTADLMGLLNAYGAQRAKGLARRSYAARPRQAYALEAARRRLEALMPDLFDWRPLETLSPRPVPGAGAPTPASVLASLFGAALELVRDGRLEADQKGAFAPLFLRARGQRRSP